MEAQLHQVARAARELRMRKRLKYTDEMRMALETSFQKNMFPSREERERLSEICNITYDQVTVWFQNRRSGRNIGAGSAASVNQQEAPIKPPQDSDSATDDDLPDAKKPDSPPSSPDLPKDRLESAPPFRLPPPLTLPPVLCQSNDGPQRYSQQPTTNGQQMRPQNVHPAYTLPQFLHPMTLSSPRAPYEAASARLARASAPTSSSAAYLNAFQKYQNSALQRTSANGPASVNGLPVDQGTSSEPPRLRMRLNEQQKSALERAFAEAPFPSREARVMLTDETGMTLDQVKKWMERRRKKSPSAQIDKGSVQDLPVATEPALGLPATQPMPLQAPTLLQAHALFLTLGPQGSTGNGSSQAQPNGQSVPSSSPGCAADGPGQDNAPRAQPPENKSGDQIPQDKPSSSLPSWLQAAKDEANNSKEEPSKQELRPGRFNLDSARSDLAELASFDKDDGG